MKEIKCILIKDQFLSSPLLSASPSQCGLIKWGCGGAQQAAGANRERQGPAGEEIGQSTGRHALLSKFAVQFNNLLHYVHLQQK